MMKKRIMIASLVVMLMLTACTAETLNEDVVQTIEPTTVATETKTETTVVTEPVTEPTAEPTTESTIESEVVEETTATETPTTEPTTESTTEEVDDNYLGRFKLTAYCACSKCCGIWADGITATGTVATAGRTIAVDPRVIPYGTEVIINGHTYIAEDCGGSIKGNRIDVYFDSHSEAWNFGVQYADVYIVRS